MKVCQFYHSTTVRAAVILLVALLFINWLVIPTYAYEEYYCNWCERTTRFDHHTYADRTYYWYCTVCNHKQGTGPDPIKCATPVITLTKLSSNSYRINWSVVTGADRFDLLYTKGNGYYRETVTGTSYTVSGCTGNRVSAYIRAIAQSSRYSNSDQSREVYLTLCTTLSAPTLTLSADTSYEITASWNSISHASGYSYQYADNASFSNAVSSTTTDTQVVLNDLTPNTLYYFRVRATTSDSDYENSGYASASAKTLQYPLNTPTLNNVLPLSDTELFVSFDKTDNASSYIIEYSTNSSFVNKQSMTVSD